MPVSVGAGGVACTTVVNEALELSQPDTVCDTQLVYVPAVDVFTVPAVDDPVPPVALVYQVRLPVVPVTTNGMKGSPAQ